MPTPVYPKQGQRRLAVLGWLRSCFLRVEPAGPCFSTLSDRVGQKHPTTVQHSRYGSVGTEQWACNAQQQAAAHNCPKSQRGHTPLPGQPCAGDATTGAQSLQTVMEELVSLGSQASPAGMGHLRQMDAQDTGRTRAIQRTGAAAQRATTVLPRRPSCNESSQQKQQSIMASAPDDV